MKVGLMNAVVAFSSNFFLVLLFHYHFNQNMADNLENEASQSSRSAVWPGQTPDNLHSTICRMRFVIYD